MKIPYSWIYASYIKTMFISILLLGIYMIIFIKFLDISENYYYLNNYENHNLIYSLDTTTGDSKEKILQKEIIKKANLYILSKEYLKNISIDVLSIFIKKI